MLALRSCTVRDRYATAAWRTWKTQRSLQPTWCFTTWGFETPTRQDLSALVACVARAFQNRPKRLPMKDRPDVLRIVPDERVLFQGISRGIRAISAEATGVR